MAFRNINHQLPFLERPEIDATVADRTEEAIATAVDLWTAFREGAFGEAPRPFVAWLVLVEDAPESRSPVRDTSPHFPVISRIPGRVVS